MTKTFKITSFSLSKFSLKFIHNKYFLIHFLRIFFYKIVTKTAFCMLLRSLKRRTHAYDSGWCLKLWINKNCWTGVLKSFQGRFLVPLIALHPLKFKHKLSFIVCCYQPVTERLREGSLKDILVVVVLLWCFQKPSKKIIGFYSQ